MTDAIEVKMQSHTVTCLLINGKTIKKTTNAYCVRVLAAEKYTISWDLMSPPQLPRYTPITTMHISRPWNY